MSCFVASLNPQPLLQLVCLERMDGKSAMDVCCWHVRRAYLLQCFVAAIYGWWSVRRTYLLHCFVPAMGEPPRWGQGVAACGGCQAVIWCWPMRRAYMLHCFVAAMGEPPQWGQGVAACVNAKPWSSSCLHLSSPRGSLRSTIFVSSRRDSFGLMPHLFFVIVESNASYLLSW